MSGEEKKQVRETDWRKAFVEAGGSLHSPRTQTDNSKVFLLLDTSGSMDGLALKQAQEGAIKFSQNAISEGWIVGVISFDSAVKECVEPTGDIEVIKRGLPTWAFGSTAMHLGLLHASGKLRRGRQARAICLVSDGQPDDPASALAAAETAKCHGIQILCIGIEGADHEFLKRLASSSGSALRSKIETLSTDMAQSSQLLLKARS